MSKPSSSEEPRIVIIGAGLGGISTALALKTQLKFEGFTIYEKGSGVGGVWRENTYPGCGSDVPAHWYSLSTALNPNWTSYYSSQSEILAYWQDLWTRHSLAAHTSFSTEVVSATWDASRQHYDVLLEDRTTGAQRTERANVVVWAAGGPFQEPLYPKDLPGAANFKGPVWHSARWRHDVELKGKRVGVIGNGCSAAQFIPVISEEPTVEVINFCRTPQWYVPRYDYSASVKWIFAHVPFVMKAYRAFVMATSDIRYLALRRTGTRIQRQAREKLTQYVKETAPEKYHAQLIPEYPPGCRRMIIDPSYLASLHRPNVDLNWTGIDSIVEDGIRLKTGEVIKLDVIILSTGFSLVPPRLDIRGSKDVLLSEHFKAHEGAAAYLGLSVPGFPNFFMLPGPNSGGGHASLIFVEEVQIQHALQLIKPILQHKAQSFEVREDVTNKYNKWLQEGLAKTVWTHCTSYYRGDNKDGKNVTNFAGPVTLFWWLARKPRIADYIATGAEVFLSQRWWKWW
ncbi:FAD/NAD(P)-binding domain-containing protein [Auriscalpium vulgare]|uniref:FAD/NAD(P)-binding domain-containing protein n=1 Tax=Auriscalpium vulgare TaxID=40419 RepID=A0ACB8R6V1_9AGAM|nr:FAD/NAD(P)-binding domain-containing protein [Auriscalpium vulgare]